MATPARRLGIPAALLVLVTACGGGGDDAAPTTAEVATTAVATTEGVTTTAAGPTTTGPATTAAPTTAAPSPTTDPVTGDRPVAGGVVEIMVEVGVDDAATLGGRVEQVPLGAEVELRLYSTSAEEYHVHGLDLEQAVPGGVEAVFEFTADRAGQFEVESHTTGRLLVVLQVS